ncbi:MULTISPECIES: pseudouridine synthase [Streptomyces]|uniref:pseudouridine synthase n=1 Tax=Streptomyces scabiei TaxID=1930 RepID=UPI00099D7888|nr:MULTISPECIES: pseudouridine synthase [Streptomyces]MBP5864743.1 pseudouridylate synthase [Streptomyces sp. LBUM 1484]MBP5866333.1 pseudouridylate synthase [Streptomyces sp. LBUM 1485]MBP5874582.1 pseudouridylate synthase [Streptomyces sp. LBUM 1477]MBP5882332.1 pseudouridylate synthase [Streptomyces sp. LBUM 1487]MBP5894786.1 pseudouridylate synthase [Streptomyces sp. LBUM 1481]
MRRRSPAPPAPLPQRDGIDPVRVRLPQGSAWATVRDHLVERLAAGAGVIDGMLDAGLIVDADGRAVSRERAYVPGMSVWFHRDLPHEVPVPFPLDIVYRDDHIVVVDKPHFLATTPRGSHITETALARLRRELAVPTLSAAHRLDRLTAGLVLFTVRPGERGAYQSLFRDRLVTKEYEAVAPYDPSVVLPCTVRSRIVKERGVMAAREVEGEPNAVSGVELLDRRAGGPARYRLLPRTGQTHQLRVHMASLGLPILGDPLYPLVRDPVPPGDFRRPLQLLARALEFTDPVTGLAHRFVSGRVLQAWSSYETWAEPAPRTRPDGIS